MNNSAYQKYILIGGVALAALLLIVTVWVTASRRNQITREMSETSDDQMESGEMREKENAQTPSQNVAETQEHVRQEPQVTLDTLPAPSEMPKAPSQVPVYRFKKYAAEDVARIANTLGFAQQTSEGNVTIAYTLEDTPQRGWVQVDSGRGVLTYRSYATAPVSYGTDPAKAASSFMTKLQLMDPTISCGITYLRASMPGVTMVECHRDWNKVGLPIVNFVGLINVPVEQRLSSMKVGMVYQTGAQDDPDIVTISTGQTGYHRPDDFNTATVAVASDGSILSLTSNIRPIAGQQMVSSSDIISPEEAMQKMSTGQSDLSYTRPAGDGSTDWDMVFPNGQAQGTNVSTTDMTLAYVESPQSQEYLVPMYIIRGTTNLSSGYAAIFLRGVAATRIGLSMGATSGSVAGAQTNLIAQSPGSDAYNQGLHLGTFGFEPTGTPDGNTTGDTMGCKPPEGQLYPLMSLAGYGQVGPWSIDPTGLFHDPNDKPRKGNYYLIPENKQVLPQIATVTSAFDALSIPGKKAELRELDRLQKEWMAYAQCPIRLSGASPTIFVYGESGSSYAVKPESTLTYVYPSISSDGAWRGMISSSGLISSASSTVSAVPYLYYEYSPVTFDRPTEGWNTSRSSLSDLVSHGIAPMLGLTGMETSRLVYELQHAAAGIKNEKLFVGKIPEEEVMRKLPLSGDVNGKNVPITRVQFYVGKQKGNTIAPSLKSVERVAEMILEFGASKGE